MISKLIDTIEFMSLYVMRLKRLIKNTKKKLLGSIIQLWRNTIQMLNSEELFVDDNIMRSLERDVLLRVVDNQWIDHLHNIDMLKEGIGLRAYGQKTRLLSTKRSV